MDRCLWDVVPEGSVVGALMLPAHLDLARSLRAQEDGALAIELVDGVDG